MYSIKRNKYKTISSQDWSYENELGTYSTDFFVLEGKVIFEKAYGKPNLEDVKTALNIVKEIIRIHFTSFKPHYISDTRDIKGANADVRKYIAEFHRNNPVFESVSLVANIITRALFRIVKSIGIGDLKDWNIYSNENDCINEILKGEVIVGESQDETKYGLIYKALVELSNEDLSYEGVINKNESNEELSSVIQAIQIITEENQPKQKSLDFNAINGDTDSDSGSILFKSILENTDVIVGLMDENLGIITVNKKFNDFFGIDSTENKRLVHFLEIGKSNSRDLKEGNRTEFLSSHLGKSISCKLHKIEDLEGSAHIVFIGEEIKFKIEYEVIDTKLQKGESSIEQITNYINGNYYKPEMTLAHLSDIFPWSEKYISSTLKDNYPVNSFREYINGIRIEEAKRLLIKTDKNVAEIGYEVGFTNPNTFNRVFKQFVNSTPREFYLNERR